MAEASFIDLSITLKLEESDAIAVQIFTKLVTVAEYILTISDLKQTAVEVFNQVIEQQSKQVVSSMRLHKGAIVLWPKFETEAGISQDKVKDSGTNLTVVISGGWEKTIERCVRFNAEDYRFVVGDPNPDPNKIDSWVLDESVSILQVIQSLSKTRSGVVNVIRLMLVAERLIPLPETAFEIVSTREQRGLQNTYTIYNIRISQASSEWNIQKRYSGKGCVLCYVMLCCFGMFCWLSNKLVSFMFF